MRRLWILIACAWLALPSSARADRKEAGERYKKAVSLYKEGDYGAALAEFRAAYNASPTWEVLYNIGLSERRLFKYGQAVKTLNRYLEEGGKKVPKDRRESVEKELEQISGLTAVISVTVTGPAAKGAKLSVDGEVLGLAPLTEVLLLGPGRHTFKAEREGFAAEEKVVEVVSRTKVEVSLTPRSKDELLPAEVTIDSAPSGAVLTIDGKLAGLGPTRVQLSPGGHEVIAELDGYGSTRTEVVVAAGQTRTVVISLDKPEGGGGGISRRRPFPLLGVIVGAAGVGLLAGGIALNVQAGSEAKKTSALFASGGTWDASAAATQSAGLSAQTWSWVLTVAGSAALAAGVVLSLVTLFGSNGDAESALWIAPNPLGVTLGWSFSP
jgi:hypothetical protein